MRSSARFVPGLVGMCLATACGADAGVPSVSTTVDGVVVTCRAETGSLDATACGEWGLELLELHPDATSVAITRHPGAEGPCEVDFFRDENVVESVLDIPCRALEGGT